MTIDNKLQSGASFTIYILSISHLIYSQAS